MLKVKMCLKMLFTMICSVISQRDKQKPRVKELSLLVDDQSEQTMAGFLAVGVNTCK